MVHHPAKALLLDMRQQPLRTQIGRGWSSNRATRAARAASTARHSPDPQRVEVRHGDTIVARAINDTALQFVVASPGGVTACCLRVHASNGCPEQTVARVVVAAVTVQSWRSEHGWRERRRCGAGLFRCCASSANGIDDTREHGNDPDHAEADHQHHHDH